MGKSRRNRSKAAFRRDPVSKPVKPLTDPELVTIRESKILPVLKDLQSSNPKERSAAATAVSSIIQDARCRKLLLREQIVHVVLSQTLTDAALESRVAGWSILNVLAQEEEADFCVHLYRSDVLTAAEFASKTVIDKLTSSEPEFQKLSKAEQHWTLKLASSLVALITILAEAQDEILVAVSSNTSIAHMLFTLTSLDLGKDELAVSLRSDAMACLMTLCEDNKSFAGNLNSPAGKQCIQSLLQLRKNADGDGVLACGVLHNIFTLSAELDFADDTNLGDDTLLIPTLAQVIASIGGDESMTDSAGWSSAFEYQQLALEIIASIGTDLNQSPADSVKDQQQNGDADWDGIKDDEDMGGVAEEDVAVNGQEDEEAAGDEDEDDEMDQDEMEADMEMVTGGDNHNGTGDGIDDVPVLKAIFQLIIPQLIRIIQLPNSTSTSSASSNEQTSRLQHLALSALNNISWSVAVLDFSDDHNDGILRAWEPCGRSIWESVVVPVLASDTADLELATQTTGLAWAVARSLGGSRRTPIKEDEHRKFIALYHATRGSTASNDNNNEQAPADPFQSIGVKCIGVLGQLALHPAPLPRNKEIGDFLLAVVSSLPETPAADAVQALNQLFDVYGDEDHACDKAVFWAGDYMKQLEGVVPKVKTMVKAVDKRKHAELKVLADEAATNLSRFLAYKRKHKP